MVKEGDLVFVIKVYSSSGDIKDGAYLGLSEVIRVHENDFAYITLSSKVDYSVVAEDGDEWTIPSNLCKLLWAIDTDTNP